MLYHKKIPKSIAKISRGASSITDNIKAFNKGLDAQAAIVVFKIIKNFAYTRCKKLGYKERISNTFNSSAIILGVFRFSLLGYFDIVGDLCAGKIYLG